MSCHSEVSAAGKADFLEDCSLRNRNGKPRRETATPKASADVMPIAPHIHFLENHFLENSLSILLELEGFEVSCEGLLVNFIELFCANIECE